MKAFYDGDVRTRFDAGGVHRTRRVTGGITQPQRRPADLGSGGALRDKRTFARDYLRGPTLACVVDRSELDGIPLPLAKVRALIDVDLSARGRKQVLVGTRN